jgi:hypothetical protein
MEEHMATAEKSGTTGVQALRKRVKALEDRFAELDRQDLDGRVRMIEGQNLDVRLQTVEAQNLDGRIDGLEAQNLDGRIDGLEAQNLDGRIAALEGQQIDPVDETDALVRDVQGSIRGFLRAGDERADRLAPILANIQAHQADLAAGDAAAIAQHGDIVGDLRASITNVIRGV